MKLKTIISKVEGPLRIYNVFLWNLLYVIGLICIPIVIVAGITGHSIIQLLAILFLVAYGCGVILIRTGAVIVDLKFKNGEARNYLWGLIA